MENEEGGLAVAVSRVRLLTKTPLKGFDTSSFRDIDLRPSEDLREGCDLVLFLRKAMVVGIKLLFRFENYL